MPWEDASSIRTRNAAASVFTVRVWKMGGGASSIIGPIAQRGIQACLTQTRTPKLARHPKMAALTPNHLQMAAPTPNHLQIVALTGDDRRLPGRDIVR